MLGDRAFHGVCRENNQKEEHGTSLGIAQRIREYKGPEAFNLH